MSNLSRMRPTPAMIVALVALVAATSGAAVALPGKAKVKANDIAKGAVKTTTIARGAVGSQQVKGKSIRGNRLKDGAVRTKQLGDEAVTTAKLVDGAVTAAKIAAGAITADQIADATITSQQVADEGLDSSNISDYAVISSDAGNLVRVEATEAATEAAARTAAPEEALFSKGDLSITAKCFRDTAANTTFAEIYVKTAADGAIFDGEDELNGGPAATDFLNTDTALVNSELDSTAATGADAVMNQGEFTAVGPDGTHLIGQLTTAAKNGALAGGDGVYGEGNVCLFGGEIAG